MSDGVAGRGNGAHAGRDSAPSLYCLMFFQVGKVACIRFTWLRKASGTFSTSAGSVPNLYSTSGIRISAFGNTWALVSFTHRPEM